VPPAVGDVGVSGLDHDSLAGSVDDGAPWLADTSLQSAADLDLVLAARGGRAALLQHVVVTGAQVAGHPQPHGHGEGLGARVERGRVRHGHHATGEVEGVSGMIGHARSHRTTDLPVVGRVRGIVRHGRASGLVQVPETYSCRCRLRAGRQHQDGGSGRDEYCGSTLHSDSISMYWT
jgi:hypothetical protein